MTGDLAAHVRLSYGVAYHPAIFIPVLSVNLTRNSPFLSKKKSFFATGLLQNPWWQCRSVHQGAAEPNRADSKCCSAPAELLNTQPFANKLIISAFRVIMICQDCVHSFIAF